MKIYVILFSALFISACSTTPVNRQTAEPVPASRIYATNLVNPINLEHKAYVSFFRDAGMFGSGCTHDLYVNNIKAFSINSREFIELALDAGDYFFRLETGKGLCPNIATSQDAVLKDGSHQSYRILLPSDGSLRLTRIK